MLNRKRCDLDVSETRKKKQTYVRSFAGVSCGSNNFLNRKRCSSDAGDVSHVLMDMRNAPDQEDSAAADILFAMR